MAETGAVIYMSHPETELHVKLGLVFRTINDMPKPDLDEAEKILRKDGARILPVKSDELVDQLIQDINEGNGDPKSDFIAESRDYNSRYILYYFIFGGNGESLLSALLRYIKNLVVGVDVRGYLYGDDDPWEVFYRFHGGELKYIECVSNEDSCDVELPDVYRWWHDGLPVAIKQGFLHTGSFRSGVEVVEEHTYTKSTDLEIIREVGGKISEEGYIQHELENRQPFYGVVHESEYTDSGLVIVPGGYLWPIAFDDIDIVLDDMSCVNLGDHVRIAVTSCEKITEYILKAELVDDPIKLK